MKRWLRPLACGLLLVASSLHAQESKGFVYMASTLGPIDSGIVDALEKAFEADTGIRVRHVGAGTGAALEIAKQGSVDVVLVHAKGAEGNTSTLLFTDAQNAYTVIDRASYLGAKDKIKLAVLVEGDEVLLNHISVIPESQE